MSRKLRDCVCGNDDIVFCIIHRQHKRAGTRLALKCTRCGRCVVSSIANGSRLSRIPELKRYLVGQWNKGVTVSKPGDPWTVIGARAESVNYTPSVMEIFSNIMNGRFRWWN